MHSPEGVKQNDSHTSHEPNLHTQERKDLGGNRVHHTAALSRSYILIHHSKNFLRTVPSSSDGGTGVVPTTTSGMSKSASTRSEHCVALPGTSLWRIVPSLYPYFTRNASSRDFTFA